MHVVLPVPCERRAGRRPHALIGWSGPVPTGLRSACAGLAVAMAGILAPEPVSAQPPADGRRVVTAVRLAEGEAIQIDGRLDEPAWQRAVPASDFRQQDPDNGAPATEATEVRVLYSRQRLYIGVVAFDSEPGRILGNQMQRDQPFSADDRFMWTLDPYLDGRSGYFFEINPSGAMGDGVLEQQQGTTSTNKSWDGIWNARVRRSDAGWTAEIEIPFNTLNFDPGSDAWGINFQRTVRRKNEESLWSAWPRNQGLSSMTHAGLLVGLSELSQGVGLDIKPYLLGNAVASPVTGAPELRASGAAGVDLFYSVTPALRANFTVNTDFAETEVDARRVNLTRFPLRFPEKREFFLEGSSFLDFASGMSQGAEAFFSRRIGLTGGRSQPVDFGTKLTGQAGRQDIGLLQMRTRATDLAPGEDFAAIRIRRRLLTQSYAGMIYTWRHARNGGPHLHTAGVDFNLVTSTFRGRQNLAFGGYYVENNTPDAGGGGASFGLRLNFPNEPWNGLVSYREIQDAYDPAIGFVQRRAIRRANPRLRYTPRLSGHRYIRSVTFEHNLILAMNLDNELLTREFTLTPLQVDFHSGDSVRLNVIPAFERLDRDFTIHDGIVLPRGSSYNFTRYNVRAQSAARRPLAVQAQYDWGHFYSGDRREVSVGLDVRPRPGVALGLEGEWNDVALPEGRFATRLLRAVANVQPSPWMSFVNNLQYDSVSRSLGWQFRFRWITRPGDDLYVVYTHNWADAAEEQRFHTLDRQIAVKVLRTLRF
jgi:hypothetical protein